MQPFSRVESITPVPRHAHGLGIYGFVQVEMVFIRTVLRGWVGFAAASQPDRKPPQRGPAAPAIGSRHGPSSRNGSESWGSGNPNAAASPRGAGRPVPPLFSVRTPCARLRRRMLRRSRHPCPPAGGGRRQTPGLRVSHNRAPVREPRRW